MWFRGKIIFFIVSLNFLAYVLASAQTIEPDSANRLAYSNVEGNFKSVVQNKTLLYNGREYTMYDHRIKGSPFLDENLLKGNVYYRDYYFRDVSMFYDMMNDEIVILSYDQFSFIQLVKTNIDYFDLAGHHYIKLATDSSDGFVIKTGFYEVLHEGKTLGLAKRIKKVQEGQSAELPSQFKQFNYYIIKKGKNYFQVTSKKSILDVLSDKRSALSSFIRQQHLNFKQDFEPAFRRMLAYYDQLNH